MATRVSRIAAKLDAEAAPEKRKALRGLLAQAKDFGTGRGSDTIIAHLNANEAAALHHLTDGGSINPRTGLLEFDEGDGGDAGDASDGEDDGPGSDGPDDSTDADQDDAGYGMDMGWSGPDGPSGPSGPSGPDGPTDADKDDAGYGMDMGFDVDGFSEVDQDDLDYGLELSTDIDVDDAGYGASIGAGAGANSGGIAGWATRQVNQAISNPVSTAINIGVGAVPGIGQVATAYNMVASLTGLPSIGSMVTSAARDATGYSPSQASPPSAGPSGSKGPAAQSGSPDPAAGGAGASGGGLLSRGTDALTGAPPVNSHVGAGLLSPDGNRLKDVGGPTPMAQFGPMGMGDGQYVYDPNTGRVRFVPSAA